MNNQCNKTLSNETCNNQSLQKSRSESRIFYNCNIHSLKHIVESCKGSASMLREKLLGYTRLSQPHVTDMAITHNFLTLEQVIEDIKRDQTQGQQNNIELPQVIEGLSSIEPIIQMQDTKCQENHRLIQTIRASLRISPTFKGSAPPSGTQTPIKNVEMSADDFSPTNQKTHSLKCVDTSKTNKSTLLSYSSKTIHTEKKQLAEIREEFIHSNFDVDMLINAQREEEEICSLHNISSQSSNEEDQQNEDSFEDPNMLDKEAVLVECLENSIESKEEVINGNKIQQLIENLSSQMRTKSRLSTKNRNSYEEKHMEQESTSLKSKSCNNNKDIKIVEKSFHAKDEDKEDDTNQTIANEVVLFKKRSPSNKTKETEKIPQCQSSFEDITLSEFKYEHPTKNDKRDYSEIILSDEEYNHILCCVLEVLGVSVAEVIKEYIQTLNLSNTNSGSKMEYLLYQKTYQYDQMIKRYFEPKEESSEIKGITPNSMSYLSSSDSSIPQMFQSPYDIALAAIYKIYLKLIREKKSIQDVEECIMQIILLINETLSNSGQNTLTTTEISNLKLLKDKVASSKEYFGEQLQPLLLRKFFFLGEIAEILPENIDEIKLMWLTHFNYFDSKFIFCFLVSMNALANSKGGVLFLGIHNIYKKVKGISINQIVKYNFIQSIRKVSTYIHPVVFFDVNLLKVEHTSFQDKPDQAYVIKIQVFPRKPNFIYYYHDFKEKKVYVKHQGLSVRLSEAQVSQLQIKRKLETDSPDLTDYLGLLKNVKIEDTNNSSNLTNGIAFQDISKEEEALTRDDILIGQIKEKRENQIKYKQTNIGLLKRPLNLNRFGTQSSSSLPGIAQLSGKCNQEEKTTRRFLGNSCNRFQQQQSVQNPNVTSLIGSFKKRTIQPSIPTQKLSIQNSSILPSNSLPVKFEKLFQNRQLRGLEQWKKNILIQNLAEDNFPTYPEFKINHPLRSKQSELINIESSQCYMIYNIEKQLEGEFQSKAIQALRQHNVKDFEYIGSFELLQIIKVDKEQYGKLLDAILIPLVVNSSVKNSLILGFGFEGFQIKTHQNLNQAIGVLESVFEMLEVSCVFKIGIKRVFIYVSNLLEYLYCYKVALRIIKIFEFKPDLNMTKIIFNQKK